MGLSDREKKIIEEMEAALKAEDPRLVATLERTRPSLLLNVAAILIGIATLLTGVITKISLVGIVGFLIALAGAATIRLKPALKRKSGSRLAERWERRNNSNSQD